MNRIVREHYPVSKLPEELRDGLHGVSEVRVVIEVKEEPALETRNTSFGIDEHPFSNFKHLARNNFKNVDDVVVHIRALRDEWDRRDQFHERLRSDS